MTGRFPIEDVRPTVACGRFAAKAVVGEVVPVSAVSYREGHGMLGANVVLRGPDGVERPFIRMRPGQAGLDQWLATIRPDAVGRWTFAVEAWGDPYRTWRDAVVKKVTAGPGGSVVRHGTFATAAKRLPAIAEMGFDIVYLPPIHPIGRVNRKGRNNALVAAEGDVGSPWAIGAAEGGHDAIHPQLGTEADFRAFVTAAHEVGMEVALDLALQCAPDHPWVREHPEWFTTRPDGQIAYAENPPKKYQDIYPINFDNDPKGIRAEVLRIVLHWVSLGVRVFRVDNPHTKPVAFWEWLIWQVKKVDPDVLFLAEAFTRPAVMHGLGKIGFTQSYTYFTWRTTAGELRQYCEELADAVDYR